MIYDVGDKGDNAALHLCRGSYTNELPQYAEIKEHYQQTVPNLIIEYPYGNGKFHLKHEDKYYASPIMVYEYIVENGYHPPTEFIEALMNGELVTDSNLHAHQTIEPNIELDPENDAK